ncbi:hypothetical protein J1C67_14500 [Clostridium gasigenes]|uniref:hypothetical protein n=1 Tax=Clostridium gasigenes TaxID=94869 RepID=UPI0014386A9A|nr:hypothetical protein [Clostridium gasigenes]NKF05293.1 hypothetical protein [Clostridium gasigenes]QSW18748.1 hypothetical protein J1C67_14500 [Clostridium gasigenes]
MPLKSCSGCNKIVPYNHVCKVIAKEKSKARNSKEDAHIYNTPEWKRLRKDIHSRYNSVDLWSFYVDGTIKEAKVIHHIIEINANKELAYDYNNVIPLSVDSHTLIHKLYKTKHKDDVKELLYMFKKMYEDNKRLDYMGKYNTTTKGCKLGVNE